ncbi:sigma-70 family RNA polymerase sigma factor [Nocardioides sp.]|uniref:RNA polymerase sigma factor n=1 Tax=Nocardioides sp. TaxID=35761 RepID=UPI002B9ADD48|nr:sigma-70 family RNA polymerase sigma factor [Nocardioides sp.]HSX66041.1 sigma-70 family RNA polymerase sigma factor [Nocardioides sp.]
MATVPPLPAADEQAQFADLARLVGPPVRRYLVRRAPGDAVDDLLAEVFLVLWRRRRDLPEDDPLPWTYAVARGCLANAARARVRRLRLLERLGAQPVPGQVDPEAGAEVRHALLALGELDREVVMLWAWEGLPPREIAVVTGLTANAVSIRLHRAKAKLAAVLGKEPGVAGQQQGEGRRP